MPRYSFRRANNNTEHETLLITFHRRTVFVWQDTVCIEVRPCHFHSIKLLPSSSCSRPLPVNQSHAVEPHRGHYTVPTCTWLHTFWPFEPHFIGFRSLDSRPSVCLFAPFQNKILTWKKNHFFSLNNIRFI